MKFVLSLLVLLFSFNLSAERVLLDETTYYQREASVKKDGLWVVELFYVETDKLAFRGILSAADISKAHVVGDFEYFWPNGKLFRKGTIDVNRHYQGRYLQYGKDGTLLQESYFKDNKMDGEQKTFHVNGNLKQRYHMSNGVLLGVSQTYFENGQLQEQVNYGAKGMEGLYEYFYPDGKPKEAVMMKAGKREGEYKYWSSEGKLQSKMDYLGGMLHGEMATYREDGTLQVIWHYQSGEMVKAKYFRDDGKVSGEIMYDDSGREVHSVSYNDKGDVVAQTDKQYLSKGTISTIKEFTSSGKIKYLRQEDTVKDWMLTQEFGPDGKLMAREEVKEGLYEGLNIIRDWHGVKYINYKNGKRHGDYKENDYDEQGKGFVIGQYHLGNKVDKWITQRYGLTKTEEFNQRGQTHGVQKEVAKDGTITYQAVYNNGILHGAYLKTDYNKQLVEKGQYVNGLREGAWLTESKDSYYMIWHGNYKNGREIGRWEGFSSRGHLLGLKWFDDNGKPQGKRYIFHENGELAMTEEYLDGRSETLYYFDGKASDSN